MNRGAAFSFCTGSRKLASGRGGEGRSWLVSSLERLVPPPPPSPPLTTHGHTDFMLIRDLHCPLSIPAHSRTSRTAWVPKSPQPPGCTNRIWKRACPGNPLGDTPAPRACWPGHSNSHPLTVLPSRLRPTGQLKCETTAGCLPRGFRFHHIQPPTPRTEARV